MIQSIIDPLFGQNGFNTIQITDKNVQIKTADISQPFDINSISDMSKDLFNSKLNLSLSAVKLTSSRLDFDLLFSPNSSEKLKAKGYYKTDEQSVGISLNYVFQKEVIVSGEVKTQTFEAVIDLKANVSKHIPGNSREKKEDIINFVQRVVSEVMSTVESDSKILKGFSLDKEELKNILELEDEKVAKHIQSLIELAFAVGKNKKPAKVSNSDTIAGVESYSVKFENSSANQNIFDINKLSITINPVDITDKKTNQLNNTST